MDIARWITSSLIAVPASLIAVFNCLIGCRNIVYFTSRSPSPIPVVGAVLLIAGFVIVPKTGSTASNVMLVAYLVLMMGEFMPTFAERVNGIRASITKRPPSDQ